MEKKQFSVDNCSLNFRTNFKSSTEILAIQLTMSFEDTNKLTSILDWLYERVEVYLEGSWLPLKEKNKDIFNPISITLSQLQDVAFYMLSYIKEVFQESNK